MKKPVANIKVHNIGKLIDELSKIDRDRTLIPIDPYYDEEVPTLIVWEDENTKLLSVQVSH